MPKQKGKRIQGQDLGTATSNQGAGVYASQNVRAKQSNINFGAIGKFASGIAQDRRAKLDNALYEQGRNDAHNEIVDPEHLEDRAYAEGLNAQSGSNDGIKAAASLPTALQEALQEARDSGTLDEFSVDEFVNEHAKVYQKDESDPSYLKTFNDKLDNLQRMGSSVFTQFRAKAEEEQIQAIGQDTINSAMEANASLEGGTPKNFYKNLNGTLKELGLNKVEAHQAFFSAITTAVDSGNIEGAEEAAEFFKSMGAEVRGKYGADIDRKLAIGRKRREMEILESQKATDLEKARARRAFEDTLGTSNFNQRAIDQATEDGVITSEQNVSLYRRHQESLDKQTLEVERSSIIDQYKNNPRMLFAENDPKIRKQVYESMDEDYNTMNMELLQNAAASESAIDPESQRVLEAQRGQILTQYKGLMETSQAAGHTPSAFKRLTDGAVVGTPQFGHTAGIVKALETVEGMTPFAGVDTAKLAELRSYNKLTERYSPEEATEIIKTRQETPISEQVANMRAEGFSDEFKDAVEDLTGYKSTIVKPWWPDEKTYVGPSAYLRETLKEDAAIFYSKGMSAKEATEAAKERFLETHTPIGGAWVNSVNMPKSFPKIYGDWIDNLPGDLNKDDYVIIPSRDLNEAFTLRRKSDNKEIRRKNGELMMFSYQTVVKDHLTASQAQEQEAKREALKENKARLKEERESSDVAQQRAKRLLEIEETLKQYGSNR